MAKMSDLKAARAGLSSATKKIAAAKGAGNGAAMARAAQDVIDNTSSISRVKKSFVEDAFSGKDYREIKGVKNLVHSKNPKVPNVAPSAKPNIMLNTSGTKGPDYSGLTQGLTKKDKFVTLAGPKVQGELGFKQGSYKRAKTPTILDANKAIDAGKKGGLFNAEPIVGFLKEGYQGIKDTGSAFSRISKEAGDGAKLFDTGKQALKEVYKKDGNYDVKKIAGSYMVGAGAARVATGGGLYKDRNGRTDIVGVPLI